MKERPMIFSGPMVQAIFDGKKKQTRRVVRAPKWSEPSRAGVDFGCPYGVPGDRLWVKETYAVVNDGENFGYVYRADGEGQIDREREVWKPSIFMPRFLSRLSLEIVEVRAERLQSMSTEDARAEGMSGHHPRDDFHALWNCLNGKRAPWTSNPWVWVISFEVGGVR